MAYALSNTAVARVQRTYNLNPLTVYCYPRGVCHHNIRGACRFGTRCRFIHGNLCESCFKPCLHPVDLAGNDKHKKVCPKIQITKDVECSICGEVVFQRESKNSRKFGIFPNCSHPVCLDCIMKWRLQKDYGKDLVRSCPVCRVHSDFVFPSEWWIDNSEEKTKAINEWKEQCSKTPCRNYHEKGRCPLKQKCFYLHEIPGTETQPAMVNPEPKYKPRRNLLHRHKRDDSDSDDDMRERHLQEIEEALASLAIFVEELEGLGSGLMRYLISGSDDSDDCDL